MHWERTRRDWLAGTPWSFWHLFLGFKDFDQLIGGDWVDLALAVVLVSWPMWMLAGLRFGRGVEVRVSHAGGDPATAHLDRESRLVRVDGSLDIAVRNNRQHTERVTTVRAELGRRRRWRRWQTIVDLSTGNRRVTDRLSFLDEGDMLDFGLSVSGGHDGPPLHVSGKDRLYLRVTLSLWDGKAARGEVPREIRSLGARPLTTNLADATLGGLRTTPAPVASVGLRASLWPGAGVDLVRSDTLRCAARRLHARRTTRRLVLESPEALAACSSIIAGGRSAILVGRAAGDGGQRAGRPG